MINSITGIFNSNLNVFQKKNVNFINKNSGTVFGFFPFSILRKLYNYNLIKSHLSPNNLEYFVLQYFEFIPSSCSTEGSVTLLTVFILAITVIGMGKVSITVIIYVTIISNYQIVTSSEYWTMIVTAINSPTCI